MSSYIRDTEKTFIVKTSEEKFSSAITDITDTDKKSDKISTDVIFTEDITYDTKKEIKDTDKNSESNFSQNIKETIEKSIENIFTDKESHSPDTTEISQSKMAQTTFISTEENFIAEESESEIHLSNKVTEMKSSDIKIKTDESKSESINIISDTGKPFSEEASQEISSNLAQTGTMSPIISTGKINNLTSEIDLIDISSQETFTDKETAINTKLTNEITEEKSNEGSSDEHITNTEEQSQTISSDITFGTSIPFYNDKTTNEIIDIENTTELINSNNIQGTISESGTIFADISSQNTGKPTFEIEKSTITNEIEPVTTSEEGIKSTFTDEKFTSTNMDITDNKETQTETETKIVTNEETNEMTNYESYYSEIEQEKKASTENTILEQSTVQISTYESTNINTLPEEYITSTEEKTMEETNPEISTEIQIESTISDSKSENIYMNSTDIISEIITHKYTSTEAYEESSNQETYKPTEMINTTEIISKIDTYNNLNITDIINTTYLLPLAPQVVIIEKINSTKEQIVKNITQLLSGKEIGISYKIMGENLTLIIKPINSTDLDENSTNIDFSECEKILREKNNIPDSEILTVIQLEINNADNSQILTNQVEYQIFDGNKNPLDMSVCKDTEIKITTLMNHDSLALINQDLVKEFKNLNVNVFDIKDPFFSDLCKPFSYENNDIILEDRFNFIYQNFSFCEKNCDNAKLDFEKELITCQCKVKPEMSSISAEPNFQYFDINKIKSTNIDVAKCTNIIFSFKNKSKNAGFIIFFILIIIFAFLIGWHIYKGIKPVSEFVYGEMKKYNYLKNDDRRFFEETNNEQSTKFINNRATKTVTNDNSTPTNINKINNTSRKSIKNSKKNLVKKTNPPNVLQVSQNKSRISNASSERDLVFSNFLFPRNKNLINQPKVNPPIKSSLVKKRKKASKPRTIVRTRAKTQTLEVKNDEEQNKQKEEIDNLGIIKINLNESMDEYFPKDSYRTLHNYTYKEATKYDNRNICQILYIFLLSKQIIFHTFFEKSPMVTFPVKIGLLIFMMTFDLTLNALLYTNTNISKKYRTTKDLFSFTMSNNTLIIIISSIVSLVFFQILFKLSKTENGIRSIFRKEEAKIKKNKTYRTDYPTKMRIFTEVEDVLKKYRIRLFIIFGIEFVIMLFCWFFVTAFCQVYSHTQGSLILNCFISIIIRFVIEVLICLLGAKLYLAAAHIEYPKFYQIILFFYDFSC